MKAVIPAAGLGTRLLPITKAVPKALLPVDGKPAIQWTLEEAVAAGCRDIVVVVNPAQASVREFLTPLESGHPLAGHPGLEELETLLRQVSIAFVEQPAPLGLWDAIGRCRPVLGDEPFALLLPDNICPEQPALLGRLRRVQERFRRSVIAVDPRGRGGPLVLEPLEPDVFAVSAVLTDDRARGIQARPGVGRYVFTPAVFESLRPTPDGEATEVPALARLAAMSQLLGVAIHRPIIHLGN